MWMLACVSAALLLWQEGALLTARASNVLEGVGSPTMFTMLAPPMGYHHTVDTTELFQRVRL